MSAAITKAELAEYRESEYPDAPPLAYVLRARFYQRWFRIHTLPSSKRYAESGQERRVILDRHNAILERMVGPDRPFAPDLFSCYSETVDTASPPTWLAGRLAEFHVFSTVELENEASLAGFWHSYMVPSVWRVTAFDDLLRQVADDVVADVLFVSIEKRTAYAPYDGGADAFLHAPAERDALRDEFAAWLPDTSDGL